MSVRVVARIRPLLKGESEKDIIVRAGSKKNDEDDDTAIVRIPNPKNENEDFTFQFNSVYDAQATQEDIFQAEGIYVFSRCSSSSSSRYLCELYVKCC